MGKKVLVVDDAAFMRMMLKDILQKNDFEDDIRKRTIEIDNITTTARTLKLSNPRSGKMQEFLYRAIDDLTSVSIATRSEEISKKYNIIQKTNFPLFEKAQIVWTKLREKELVVGQGELFKSFAIISPQFRDLLEEHCVPVESDIYHSLDARMQDLYVWAVKSIESINKDGEGRKIGWKFLISQFFDHFRNITDQTESLIKDLNEIKKIYPDIRLEMKKEGVILLPSRLHIEKKCYVT